MSTTTINSLILKSHVSFCGTEGSRSTFEIKDVKDNVRFDFDHSTGVINVSGNSEYAGATKASPTVSSRINDEATAGNSSSSNYYGTAIGPVPVLPKRVRPYDSLEENDSICDAVTVAKNCVEVYGKRRYFNWVSLMADRLGIPHVGFNQYSRNATDRVEKLTRKFNLRISSICQVLRINRGEFELRREMVKDKLQEDSTHHTFISNDGHAKTVYYSKSFMDMIAKLSSGLTPEDTSLLSVEETRELLMLSDRTNINAYLATRGIKPVIRGKYLKATIDKYFNQAERYHLSVKTLAKMTNIHLLKVYEYVRSGLLDGFYARTKGDGIRFANEAVDAINAVHAARRIRARRRSARNSNND